ncbi:hypothetical protein FALBO_7919 [Fusarium albosuccineum]|uniref:Uncharacterized protein n=1 Tax=Fusarium albosuccineum TaxID=1237068 RepID=A0A8H4L993_9HYPO|nr:hypothetical protein FALBO_7919 [Fusarium albosuccineum]
MTGRSSGHHRRPRAPSVGFLFIVNKLVIEAPDVDAYQHHIPPTTVNGYRGEFPSTAMRYRDGEITPATGFQWYRDTTSLPASGKLLWADGNGGWAPDGAGGVWGAQEYKTFAVAACNPLLPIMVVDQDPLATHSTGCWELLRIFHPRQPDLVGISQVAIPESPMGQGGNPVRYVAGRSPSWMPSLLPKTYRSPLSSAPSSRGLGGELPIILGLMALSADNKERNAATDEVFLGVNGHGRKWRNGEWRGNDPPKGYPDTAQDDPRVFLVKVFYDPEHPITPETFRWFEWQNAIVRESR